MGSDKSLLRLAVLASGRGSNLQAIIDSIKNSTLAAKVVVVISDNPEALALERARQEGIPAVSLPPAEYRTKDEYEQRLVEVCEDSQADLVVLAGYMRMLGRTFLKRFPNRVVNIHPSLLPSFPGLHAQRQAIEYGVRFSGCTVHFVDEGMDTGPIILQAVVPVHSNDTEETLAERILVQEHQLYPQALNLIARGQIQIEGRRVRLKE
ncbi:MAG: phosphoribosylglycinamide formyltransferase [Syntrophomonadaceae bacterium]|nr:phosphoribosylglycinamide formyltransferase [Syntrophomonadaceae bacterium]